MADTDASISTSILLVLVICTVLSTLAVSIRIYTRHFLLRSFGKDDAVMVGGWVFLLATSICIGLEYQFGMGKHISTVPEENYLPYMKSFLASTIVYSISNYLVKISIMLQYCRIFQNTQFHRVYFGVMLCLSFWTILMTFLLTFICVPISRFWDPTGPGSCMNRLALWLSVGVINMVTDLTCFLIPIPPLLKLRMPRNQKILLTGIFALALCPCIISAYRITTLLVVVETTDVTWDNAETAIWTFLELNTGAIAACLPTFRPVLVKIMPRMFASSGRSVSTQPGRPRQEQHGISLQTSHTNAKGFGKGKEDTESTRDLGLSEHEEGSAWDRDEISLNQSTRGTQLV